MTYLSLRDQKSGTVREFELSEVRLGRDPVSEWQVVGEGADVVSGNHARLLHKNGHWFVEDVGSRNGTTVNEKLISHGKPEQLSVGSVIGLGDKGPRFRVEAVEKRRIANTIIEPIRAARPSAPTMPMKALEDSTLPMPGVGDKTAPLEAQPAAPKATPAPPPPPPAPAPPPPPSMEITMKETRTGNRYSAKGGRVRLGRGDECELRPLREGDTSVSRVHAEIVLRPDGRAVIRDLKSRNGTYVNGELLTGDHPLVLEDRVTLGEGGPDLVVEALKLPGGERQESARKMPVAQSPEAAAAKKPGMPRRSFAGKGKTVFFREMMEETTKKSASRLRVVVWTFVFLLSAAVGGFWWYTEQQSQETARAFAAASEKTTALESALKSAEAAMRQQAAAGDSAQRSSQAELARLQGELGRASRTTTSGDDGSSRAILDSLRAAIREQEKKNAAIAAQVRAVKGVNLTAISQASGAAVGFVGAYFKDGTFDGSGFVLTKSGYFVTNEHVVRDPKTHQMPDRITVILNDTRLELPADVVSIPNGNEPDLAVLKIRNYQGPVVADVDWTGTHVRQGDPAALIGYPGGYAIARDQASGLFKTSMSAGIFSKVAPEQIQFDGFSVHGSSGSPIFNADGEIVGVHHAGLADNVNEDQKHFSFVVPIKLLVPLLPPEARNELGLR